MYTYVCMYVCVCIYIYIYIYTHHMYVRQAKEGWYRRSRENTNRGVDESWSDPFFSSLSCTLSPFLMLLFFTVYYYIILLFYLLLYSYYICLFYLISFRFKLYFAVFHAPLSKSVARKLREEAPRLQRIVLMCIDQYLSLSLYIYIYMYIYIYVYVDMCVDMCIYIYIYIYIGSSTATARTLGSDGSCSRAWSRRELNQYKYNRIPRSIQCATHGDIIMQDTQHLFCI